MSDNIKRERHEIPEDPASMDVFLDNPSLSDGQRRRLSLFRNLEGVVCARVEEMCATGDIDVTDVAVLVVDASAHDLLFRQGEPCGTTILVGHRCEVRSFLNSMLPAAEDAPFDPYDDLMEPSPLQSIRVLILDDHSLTVMSYGTFVTVHMDPDEMPKA
ncbi:MAG: hypothetical protein IPM54_29985 [Polyangiaceae bacterium]|nr:hypothetical protein [Polyangiaceae bacterium]